MVTAEDGARLDRRYTYKAVEDVGGFCFENGKAVSCWPGRLAIAWLAAS